MLVANAPSNAHTHCCKDRLRLRLLTCFALLQGCVFTQDVNQAIYISDAMETGTVQVKPGCAVPTSTRLQQNHTSTSTTILPKEPETVRLISTYCTLLQVNAAPARGPDHFP